MLKPRALQTLRACRASANLSKRLDCGAFTAAFATAPGTVFGVLATTNVALPMSNWTAFGGVTEISPGQFQFTDPQVTTNAQRFYRLRVP